MASFFIRITDIISANINDMIDRVEDPERMIKQIIREMEENIHRARGGVLDAIAREKQLYRDLQHHRRKSEAWQGKAETALRRNQRDLAVKALTRKKEHDRIIEDLEAAWSSAESTSRSLKSQYRKLEAKLEEARRKRSALAARQRMAEARTRLGTTVHRFERGVAIEEKFDRMESRVVEIEARSDAVADLDDEATELEREFEELETDAAVEAELADLERKIGEGPERIG